MSFSDERFADHREAWELIPWVVNDTASEQERALVQAHVAGCADCAVELQVQSRLHAAMAVASAPGANPAASFERLRARLDEAVGARGASRGALSVLGARRALVAVVMLQTVGLLALGAALWVRGSSANPSVYRTLGAAADTPQPAVLRAVIDPAVRLGELESTLADLRLQIVGGPSPAGVLSLAPEARGAAETDLAQTLSALRRRPGVRFAEPTSAGAERR